MPQQSIPRPANMRWGPELLTWIQAHCAPQLAPYPGLQQPCQIWQRTTQNCGYGQLWFARRVHYVHRVVYALQQDLPSLDALTGLILHRCDRPACCDG